jgi:hypothetical protein
MELDVVDRRRHGVAVTLADEHLDGEQLELLDERIDDVPSLQPTCRAVVATVPRAPPEGLYESLIADDD